MKTNPSKKRRRIFSRFRPTSALSMIMVVVFILGSLPIRARADVAASTTSTARPSAAPSSSTSKSPPAPSGANGAATPMASGPANAVNGTQHPTTLDAAEGSGQGSVGLASVDPSTGTAQASIPFELPAARGSGQPELALSYSSTSDIGDAGYAWSLALPRIERHNLSNGPKYIDPPPVGPGNPNDADQFELSGIRLVPICAIKAGQCSNGEHLQPGEQLPTSFPFSTSDSWTYFRPENDDTFMRVFRSFDGNTWMVQNHSLGVWMQFGAPLDNSTDTNAIDFDQQDNTLPFRWNLVRKIDANNNAVYFGWMQLSGLGYLTNIYDTLPTNNGTSIVLTPAAHHTRLAYVQDSSLSPVGPSWHHKRSWRLDHIDVASADFQGTQARHLVRRYHLLYFPRGQFAGQARSMLQSVVERPSCNVLEDATGQLPDNIDGTCGVESQVARVVAQMDYSGGLPFAKGKVPAAFGVPSTYEVNFLDINGDSKADILAQNPGDDKSAVVWIDGRPHAMTYAADLDVGLGASSSMLFNLPILGDWLQNGGLNAFKYGNPPNFTDPDSPLGERFKAAHLSDDSWQWRSDGPQGTLSQWTGGASQPPPGITFAHVPLEHYADLDADGYMDRLLSVPILQSTQIHSSNIDKVVGYKYVMYRTQVAHNGIGVSPFSLISGGQLVEPDEILNYRAKTFVTISQSYNVLESDSEQVADISGDGIPDLIREYHLEDPDDGLPTLDKLFVWYGLGNRLLSETPPVALDNFTLTNSDLNGDGIPDVVSKAGGGIHVELLDEQFHDLFAANIFVDTTNLLDPKFADVDGSGINSIILISTNDGSVTSYTVPEVSSGNLRPGLLTSISNGLGVTTQISYQKNSTTTPIPVAIHSVKSLRTTSSFASPSTGGPYVTTYNYSDPVYDAVGRRFRGYRSVEAWQGDDAQAQRVGTRTTFFINTPAYDPSSPVEFSPDNFYEAVRGRPVLVEKLAGDGTVLSSIHYQYQVQKLYDGWDGRSVRSTYPSEVDAWLYDTAAPSTGTTQVSVHDVTSTDEPSNNLDRTIAIRADASSAFAHLQTTTVMDRFGNVTSTTGHGVVDGGAGVAVDSPITQSATPGLPPGDTTGWNWRTTDTHIADRHKHFEYDSKGQLLRTYGDLKGTLPLVRFHEDPSKQVAPTPLDASQDGSNILLSDTEYDSFGNPVKATGPDGRCTTTKYDQGFGQFMVSSTVYINGCNGAGMTSTAVFDRGLGVPTMTTEPNGAMTTTEYDNWGRPIHVFDPNPNIPGMSLTDASVKSMYSGPPYSAPFRVVRVDKRDDDGSGAARYRSTWSYLDPYGHTIAMVTQADPGDPAPYIVGGQVVRDGLGQVTTQYQPYFSSFDPTTATQPPSLPASGVASSSIKYDNFERVSQTFALDGQPTGKIVYHALSRDLFDGADLAPNATQHPTTTVHDGFGRSTLTTRSTSQSGAADTLATAISYLPTGEVQSVTRSHSASSDVYTRTMIYDSFGRLVENDEPNTSTGFGTSSVKAWRYAYNAAGDLVGTSDARGCGKNIQLDGAERIVSETYSPCQNNQPDYQDKPTNLFVYDAPEQGQTGTPQLFAGRLAAFYDRAQHTQFSYDGRGRTVAVARQLAIPNDATSSTGGGGGVDAGATPGGEYAAHWYKTAFDYDEADRVVAQSMGADVDALLGQSVSSRSLAGKDLVTTTYSARGIASQVGGSYGNLITGKLVDADGLVLSQTYGDIAGTTATYQYDSRRRLSNLEIKRAAPPIWNPQSAPAGYSPPTGNTPTTLQTELAHLTFSYDPVNNPLTVIDGRNGAEWPDGAKPVSHYLTYDDLHQLREADYVYATSNGVDNYVSPFDAEAKSHDPRPIPEVELFNRMKWQKFDFDWQGNLTKSDDDVHAFFDRSMGPITHGTATNGPNRATGAREPDGYFANVTYDAAGNLTAFLMNKAVGSRGGVDMQFSYAWDEVGHLVRATRAPIDGTPEAGVDFHYTYDAGGRRVLKSVVDPNTQERRYSSEVFSTLRLNMAKFDPSTNDFDRTGDTETVYTVSNGAALGRVIYDTNAQLPSADGNRQHVYLTITDTLGSTSVVIDKASSELVEQSTYQAFGAAESDYRPTRWQSFREDYRFTGKEDDVGVGLTYFGARYYVAALGQWASADPLSIHGLGSDLNPYAYVSGSPQRLVDPTGLAQCGDVTNCGGANDGPGMMAGGLTSTEKMWDSFVSGMNAGGPTGWGAPVDRGGDPFGFRTPSPGSIGLGRLPIVEGVGLPGYMVVQYTIGRKDAPTADPTPCGPTPGSGCKAAPVTTYLDKTLTFYLWVTNPNDPRLTADALNSLSDSLYSIAHGAEWGAFAVGSVLTGHALATATYATVSVLASTQVVQAMPGLVALQVAEGGMDSLAAQDTEATFEIIDGVRRAKAAALDGQDTISATIMQGNVATGEIDIAISRLLSPKDAIDVSSSPAQFERWQSIWEGTQQGGRLPNIEITPGNSGTPISDVGFE